MMNKKLMSTLLFSAALLSAGVVTSCKDYDDDIDELRAGLEAVESLASELQSQIQKGAILTDVTATSNGVRLTLSNGNTFELTNGVDGEDGSVVEIGPNGNWFIDGVDTQKPSRGEKGDKGDPGEKGEQGEPGEPGTPGQSTSSVYYYPGTEGDENGYWIKVNVAADGSETKENTNIQWTASIKTEGVIAIWDNDVLTLRNVEGYEGDLVISLRGDLKALVFQPELVLDGQNAMEYAYIPYHPVTFDGSEKTGMMTVHQVVTGEGYAELAQPYTIKDEAVVSENWGFVNPTYCKEYHMNPTTAIISEFSQENLGVTSDDRDFIQTRAAASNPMAVWFKDVRDGKMQVGIKMEGQLVKTQEEDRTTESYFYPARKDDSKITDLAIQVPLDEQRTEVITSTYASVYASQIAIEALAYNTSSNHIITEKEFDTDHPVGSASTHSNPIGGGAHLYDKAKDAAEQSATVELAYSDANGINLNELVRIHVTANSKRSWNAAKSIYTWNEDSLKAHGMEFAFEKVPFTIGSNATEQSQNHCVLVTKTNEAGEAYTSIAACGVDSNSDTDLLDCKIDSTKIGKAIASVGRTPLIRVSIKNTENGEVVEAGFIKFKIIAPETPVAAEKFNLGDFFYRCGDQTKKITWHAIETKLLEATAESSKETFDANYHIVANEEHEVTQFVPGGEDMYGYPTYTQVPAIGTIHEIANYGAETTDVLSWTIDRADFVALAKNEGYPVVTITRYVKYEPNKGLGNTGTAKKPIYLPIEITLKYPKAVLRNKLSTYWYADNSMSETSAGDYKNMRAIHANVDVPATITDIKAASCDFYVALDSRFEKNTIGHSDKGFMGSSWNISDGPGDVCFAVNENAPKFVIQPEDTWNVVYDWNKESNFTSFQNDSLVYYYYFSLANNNRTVKGVSNKSYTLGVANTTANNDVMLFTDAEPYEFKNKVLTANGTPIAKLKYNPQNSHVRDHGVWLELMNNAVAKDLLNVPESWDGDLSKAETLLKNTLDVNIGVAAFNRECGAFLPTADNTFDVEFLKPVYAQPKDEVHFVDAYDGGEPETEVYLADLIDFYDFRVRHFADYLDYYHYYEVSDISVDPQEILTNMNSADGQWRPLKEVTNDVEFKVYRWNDTLGDYARVDDGYVVNTAAGVPAIGFTMRDIAEKHFDKLTYTNNTATVVNFDIKIPVKIKHKWSQEEFVVWVNGTVGRTQAN